MKFSIPSFARKAGHMMLTTISILLAGIIILTGILLAMSPGKPQPFLDENGDPLEGSISEKIHVDINGVEQGMFIKSKDSSNPVLLFVHGGPGMPEYWLTQRYPTGLEDHFTVVWWEQRGAGLSYSPDIPPETMTAEQFISDTLEVTTIPASALRAGKDIPDGALMGQLHRHSGGGAANRSCSMPTSASGRFHTRSNRNSLPMSMRSNTTGKTGTRTWSKSSRRRRPP